MLKEIIDTQQGEESEMEYMTKRRNEEIARTDLLLSDLGRFSKGILFKRA